MPDVLEPSILKATKKTLGISPSDTSFDHDVATFINSALATVTQLGIGPDEGIVVTDEDQEWSEITSNALLQNHLQAYVYLVTRMMFDPPQAGYLNDALKAQKVELEVRLSVTRDHILSEA